MLKLLPFIELALVVLIIPQFIWSGKEEWWKGLILPGITFFLACQIVYITPLRVLFRNGPRPTSPPPHTWPSTSSAGSPCGTKPAPKRRTQRI